MRDRDYSSVDPRLAYEPLTDWSKHTRVASAQSRLRKEGELTALSYSRNLC
jgi:hypothetical protein